MAVAELSVSRRELLGAACGFPLLSAHPERASSPSLPRRRPGRCGVEGHPGLDPGSRLPFPAAERGRGIPGQAGKDGRASSRAVADWDRALSRFRAADAALAAARGADDDTFDRLLARHNRALSRLLRTPAPDAAALAVKLDALVAHQAWELTFAAPALAAIRRDARRLAAVRPS